MIIGRYPCCDAPLTLSVPAKTPVWFKESCPRCEATVWHRVSRFDPMSWTERDFEAEFNIDHESKIITRKDGLDTEVRVPA